MKCKHKVSKGRIVVYTFERDTQALNAILMIFQFRNVSLVSFWFLNMPTLHFLPAYKAMQRIPGLFKESVNSLLFPPLRRL